MKPGTAYLVKSFGLPGKVMLNEEALLKLLRKLQPGDNADISVIELLAE